LLTAVVIRKTQRTATPATAMPLVITAEIFLPIKTNKMKKQTNLPAAGKKLSLNKKTISNLSAAEMNKKAGGNSGWTCTWTCGCHSKFYCTHGKTC
jgi:natural product precursor